MFVIFGFLWGLLTPKPEVVQVQAAPRQLPRPGRQPGPLVGTDVGETLQAAAAGAINTAAQLGTALGVAALLLIDATSRHARLRRP